MYKSKSLVLLASFLILPILAQDKKNKSKTPEKKKTNDWNYDGAPAQRKIWIKCASCLNRQQIELSSEKFKHYCKYCHKELGASA